MKRICLTLLALCASISLVGCCYRPYTFDQCTGRGYGGGWEPCCGGPLDPLGIFCCYGGCAPGAYNPWHGGYPAYGNYATSPMTMGSPVYGTPGCANCGTEPMMATPTYVPEGAPMMQEQPATPGGGLKPVPDPMMKQQEKSNGTTTYVLPPSTPTMHRPVQFVPAQPRGVYRATQQPYVQAH